MICKLLFIKNKTKVHFYIKNNIYGNNKKKKMLLIMFLFLAECRH